MKIEEKLIRNYGFDILRLISIIGVIIMHTTSMYGVDFHILDVDSFFRYILSYSFKWSVPIFFMLSGALLLSKQENPKDFYLKRLKKILIPTAFWSLIYLSIHYFFDSFSLFSLIASLLKANPYYHLWFMFAILGLYLFTPIFRIIVQNTSSKQRYWLISSIFIISILQYYLDMYLQNTSTIFTIFIPYIGFYFLGYELDILNKNLSANKKLGGFVFFTILVILLGYLSQEILHLNGNIFAGFLSPLVIGQSITLFLWISNKQIIKRPQLEKLSSLVYGVYLIHPLFILLYIHLYLTQTYPLLNIFIATILIVPISFIIVSILKKYKLTESIV